MVHATFLPERNLINLGQPQPNLVLLISLPYQ